VARLRLAQHCAIPLASPRACQGGSGCGPSDVAGGGTHGAAEVRQRAEREQAARKAREADAAARAEVLRRRAIARMAAREAEQARRSPATAAAAVLQEAVRRGGPALAMAQGDGAASGGARAARAAIVPGRCDATAVGRKRPVAEACDERDSSRARHIL